MTPRQARDLIGLAVQKELLSVAEGVKRRATINRLTREYEGSKLLEYVSTWMADITDAV